MVNGAVFFLFTSFPSCFESELGLDLFSFDGRTALVSVLTSGIDFFGWSWEQIGISGVCWDGRVEGGGQGVMEKQRSMCRFDDGVGLRCRSISGLEGKEVRG